MVEYSSKPRSWWLDAIGDSRAYIQGIYPVYWELSWRTCRCHFWFCRDTQPTWRSHIGPIGWFYPMGIGKGSLFWAHEVSWRKNAKDLSSGRSGRGNSSLKIDLYINGSSSESKHVPLLGLFHHQDLDWEIAGLEGGEKMGNWQNSTNVGWFKRYLFNLLLGIITRNSFSADDKLKGLQFESECWVFLPGLLFAGPEKSICRCCRMPRWTQKW